MFRLIFFFSARVRNSARCAPEDLAHAISSKYLSVTEVARKEKDNLTFDEFIEILTQSLRLGLQMLNLTEGFVVNSLNSLVTLKSLQNEEGFSSDNS